MGLSENELPLTKEKNEYRIFSLGDSFTEGIGTYYDSTWVKVMEKELDTTYPDKFVNNFNGGIGGSDPYFSYKLMEDELLKYQPDMVILAVNSSDIMDIIIRGGEERFGDNGEIFYKEAPRYEWLYGISFIFRHITHDIFKYNYLFLSEEENKKQELQAIERIYSIVFKFQDLSLQNNFDFVVVFHPLYWEVEQEGFNFSNLIKLINEKHKIYAINLLEYYLDSNLDIKNNLWDYYWKIDNHHNTKGYELMGDSISDAIIKMKLIDKEN